MGKRIAVLFISLLATVAACSDDNDDKPPVDAAPTADAPMICGGQLEYLQACTDSAMCGTCSCQNFGHSMICTKTCTTNADCPAPSAGCLTSSGYCRP